MAALKNRFTWDWNALPPPWNPDSVAHAHRTYWRLAEPGYDPKRKICCIFPEHEFILPEILPGPRDRMRCFLTFSWSPSHKAIPFTAWSKWSHLPSKTGLLPSKAVKVSNLSLWPTPTPSLTFHTFPNPSVPLPSAQPPLRYPGPRHKFSGKVWHVHLNTSNWISCTKKYSLWNESLYPSQFWVEGIGRNMCRLMRVQVCIYLHAYGRPSPVPFKFKECSLTQHVGKTEGCGTVTLNLDYMLGSSRRLCHTPTSGLTSSPDDQTQPGFKTTSTEEHSWALALAEVDSNLSPDTCEWHDLE